MAIRAGDVSANFAPGIQSVALEIEPAGKKSKLGVGPQKRVA